MGGEIMQTKIVDKAYHFRIIPNTILLPEHFYLEMVKKNNC